MKNELAQLLQDAARQLSGYIESKKRRDIETLGRYITDSSHALPEKLMKAAASLEAQEPVARCFTDVNGKPKDLCGHPKHRAEQDLRVYTPLYRHPPTSAVPEGMVRVEVSTSKFTSSKLLTNTEINESALRLPGMAADRAWGEISRAMAELQQGGGENA